ncbi:efflux RND transporter periplasmic adaptor subunit [Scleromatobacter humisilvae]|uniref:Efflux RND transporter periplasmic adaptor subunit n=1 Tax=Scleromatobacter humisilvae TaxID=2897159 RepID=A0A9X1YMV2_9BURK|nr:efflux RND transporter periplasmic adaptor subunit [Scleromatobacter humisilvae]MCK9684441.1 efflux RND transporter periplasmic adaptor subunit [Scleromatobacter humisilvae]
MTLSRRFTAPRTTLIAGAVALAFAAGMLAGCQKSGARSAADAASAPSSALLIAPEDVRTVALQTHASGPVITGSVQPERRADLRAEISAVVLQVLKENGEAVHKGDLLVRLDDTAIRDSLQSAEASSRAAAQALDQAQRQYARVKTLQGEGMSSQQALDDAEVRRNTAQSDRVAADSRTVAARQQMTRTEVRAPFDGVVSDRKVSAGDTAAVGKELLKVIAPDSMRFEGLVSADRMGDIHPGQAVQFRINGFDKTDFAGKVRHVDASADAVTRQVAVIVDFAPGTAPKVAGLYAEGRISSDASQALLLPEAAIVKEGDKAFVWKLAGNTLVKTPVTLGERDARLGNVVILSGVAAGDRLLRTPGSSLTSGQKFELAKPVAPAASVALGA